MPLRAELPDAGNTQRPAGRVLIVDDDYSVRRTLHITLYDQGFDVSEAASGDEALALARVVRCDAVLLDVNLPGPSAVPNSNGIDICRELRRGFPRMAILMISVRDSEDDRIMALDAGADDYVVKPFHMRELAARIRAAVRRSHAGEAERDDTITIGDIALLPARRIVKKAGKPIHLTPKEFDLLAFLMKQAGIPATHSRLLSAVWGPEYASQVEYLRTFVRQLRGKLEDNRSRPRYLLTESHIGYRFADQGELTPAAAPWVD